MHWKPAGFYFSLSRAGLFIIFLFSISSYGVAQTTYSMEEERMVHFLNNGLAYAEKYDSLQRLQPVLDSCRRFLRRYPHSFAKPNVYSYMLEMTSRITTDKEKIFPLADSVLFYDHLPGTKMRIGELLIEREIDPAKGRRFLEDVLPSLTADYHRYKSHLLLANLALSRYDFAAVKAHLASAIALDSVRLDAWYAYLGYCQIREESDQAAIIIRRIAKLRNAQYGEYLEYVDHNAYIGKSIAGMQLHDLDGKIVRLNDFTNSVKVIQFFNFWCSVPMKEFPTLNRLIRTYPRVKFIFLNFGETPDELKQRYFVRPSSRFLRDQLIAFPDSSADWIFSRVGMGEILLVDKYGTIRSSFPGMTKNLEKLLRSKLDRLLREK
ncbi:MAG: TlpA disulfide reductase family protein [Ignavibacteriales bacterium]|nr:TlpA disulfide reductase family protein [Ignavibacteriales bacterium]